MGFTSGKAQHFLFSINNINDNVDVIIMIELNSVYLATVVITMRKLRMYRSVELNTVCCNGGAQKSD